MKILALEFSPPQRSVAVIVDGKVCGFAADATPQGYRAFVFISEALKQAGLEPASVECIAVGVGPGSYAGTRMAISIAQGWQLGREIKIIGVESAEAIAVAAQRAEVLGTINIVFDAQRNEVYAVRYSIGLTEIRALDGFQLLGAQEETRRRAGGEIFVKADGSLWGKSDDLFLQSDARLIGELAGSRNLFVPGHQLEPIYLRKAEFVKAPLPKFTMSDGRGTQETTS